MAKAKEKPIPDSLNAKVHRILEAARKANADTNVFFETTLKRYTVKIRILEALEKDIAERGELVEKIDTKGNKSLVVNPSISEYNKTASAANNDVLTMIKIVQALDMSSILDVEAGEDEL